MCSNLIFLFSVLIANSAEAYMGPGAGLGMVGSLIAVGVAALVIVFGLFLYPIRLLLKRLKQKSKPQ